MVFMPKSGSSYPTDLGTNEVSSIHCIPLASFIQKCISLNEKLPIHYGLHSQQVDLVTIVVSPPRQSPQTSQWESAIPLHHRPGPSPSATANCSPYVADRRKPAASGIHRPTTTKTTKLLKPRPEHLEPQSQTRDTHSSKTLTRSS